MSDDVESDFTDSKMYDLLSSAIELVRMIRDGDSESTDEWAISTYRRYFTN